MSNKINLTENEIVSIVKEAVETILASDNVGAMHKIKKFRTKSGKPVEVEITLDENGEGDFEYSIDGGEYDYISGMLIVEDGEVVDFDGCYDLPKAVRITLKEMGIECNF